jgi:hypothetical protein
MRQVGAALTRFNEGGTGHGTERERVLQLELELGLICDAPPQARLVYLALDVDAGSVLIDWCVDGCCPPLAGPPEGTAAEPGRAAKRAARLDGRGDRRPDQTPGGRWPTRHR